MLLAYLKVVLKADEIVLLFFKRLPHPFPGCGQTHAHMLQTFQLVPDGLDHLIKPPVGLKVGGQGLLEV